MYIFILNRMYRGIFIQTTSRYLMGCCYECVCVCSGVQCSSGWHTIQRFICSIHDWRIFHRFALNKCSLTYNTYVVVRISQLSYWSLVCVCIPQRTVLKTRPFAQIKAKQNTKNWNRSRFARNSAFISQIGRLDSFHLFNRIALIIVNIP